MISIHALREEGDRLGIAAFKRGNPFLSTPSARRATADGRRGQSSRKDFYPRPPRGGRPEIRKQFLQIRRISIHALREEGDFQ